MRGMLIGWSQIMRAHGCSLAWTRVGAHLFVGPYPIQPTRIRYVYPLRYVSTFKATFVSRGKTSKKKTQKYDAEGI